MYVCMNDDIGVYDQGPKYCRLPWQFPGTYFTLGKQISFGTLCSLYILDLYLNAQVNLSE